MKNKIFFSIFMTIWVLIVILNFVWPKKTFSQEENRWLAVIPRFSFQSFVNGDYLSGVNDYINDHFAFRDIFLKINSWWEISVMGKKENNGVYIGKNGYLFEKFSLSEKEKKNILNNVKYISEFAEKMNKENIPIYFMLVPNSIYINEDKLPDNVEVPSQSDIIYLTYDQIDNTININVIDSLKDANKTLPLYFKTDHHINSDGAYVIYKEFCKSANLEYNRLEDFNKVVVSTNFLGTFDSKAQIIGQEPDELFVYEDEINTNIKEAVYDKTTTQSIFNTEYLTGKDKYSFFLNGNNAKAIIKTEVNNSKKLLVIKDSYAHIMSQFLCQNYSEVHFLDPRYTNFNYDEYIKENDITDVLILYNVSNFLTDTNLSKIIK